MAWRERQKNRIGEAGSSLSTPTSASHLSLLQAMGGPAVAAIANANATDNSGGGGAVSGGPEPMDETADVYHSGRDASEAESGSDAGGGGNIAGSGNIAGGNIAGGGGGGSVNVAAGLALGQKGPTDQERATREERAAKALQTAARVMLARKGRFQRLARETSALLVIQKRSREWLKQKQGGEEGAGGGCGGGGGASAAVDDTVAAPSFSRHSL